ncbi:MAG: tRNA threonylcarbamoyladenosine biosynthesis protein TsaB [Pyrinomonadaceae bacterium]|jgi:tRNA threonylcarbamoyladenosine biosynthesis protein TsaB|nr:tRNA threonylcarbamoyladenosine biosynthesis protein TsaB [Pyrinomonadaceae bacterium]
MSANSPLILSIETATLGGSVFVGRGQRQLAARTGDAQVSQSASLLSDINSVLEDAGVSLQEIDVFACAVGPGSFTGLRIGIATLKALAASLERPCVGVPTLAAVALAAGPASAIVSVLPAGRGEVFAQMFSVFADGSVTELDQAAHLSPRKLLAKYGVVAALRWAGNGAQLQRDVLVNFAKEQGIDFSEAPDSAVAADARCWQLAPSENKLATPVAALAFQAFQTGKLQSAEALTAIYVRPSDAELNTQCR